MPAFSASAIAGMVGVGVGVTVLVGEGVNVKGGGVKVAVGVHVTRMMLAPGRVGSGGSVGFRFAAIRLSVALPRKPTIKKIRQPEQPMEILASDDNFEYHSRNPLVMCASISLFTFTQRMDFKIMIA